MAAASSAPQPPLPQAEKRVAYIDGNQIGIRKRGPRLAERRKRLPPAMIDTPAFPRLAPQTDDGGGQDGQVFLAADRQGDDLVFIVAGKEEQIFSLVEAATVDLPALAAESIFTDALAETVLFAGDRRHQDRAARPRFARRRGIRRPARQKSRWMRVMHTVTWMKSQTSIRQ